LKIVTPLAGILGKKVEINCRVWHQFIVIYKGHFLYEHGSKQRLQSKLPMVMR